MLKLENLGLACVISGLAVLLTVDAVQAQPQDLERQKAQAIEQQQALKKRLEALQSQVQKTHRQQQQAADALQASEVAISETLRRMHQLDEMLSKTERELTAIGKKITTLNTRIARQRTALAKQLRAQYSSGLNAWSTLLAGEDPQSIGRDLGYLEFVLRSRAENIESLRKDKAELSTLLNAQNQHKQSIDENRRKLLTEQEVLAKDKAERTRVLAGLNQQLVQERREAKQLDADQQRLGNVVSTLTQQITTWREQQAKQSKEVREAALAALPQGGGIKRGLPKPVPGQVLARFGSKQPDGGAWRGVLMGAREGEPVKAVASGLVAFSKWLPRFGNLVILDHGDEFLTVYAYNQSLLKEVGDAVEAGEIVALAGNTGGQLDSALYFELRHRGAPLDPMLYFKNE